MAKQARKSGLGKGLSALLGESVEEIGGPEGSSQNRAAHDIDPAKAPDENQKVDNKLPKDEAANPAERSAGEPYIEEEDHVEIRGVVEREPKTTDEVPLTQIVPNPDQPRTSFKPEEIDELAASIAKEGLLQPIVVRALGDNYQIVAGERRWQACKKLGLRNVAVRIIDANDDKAVELALIENIQRCDLNPIEEAYGYKRLMERRGMTQSDVAAVVSKGRSTIANALRLLELPEAAQQLLYEEKISAGHARAILSVPTEEGRNKLTEKLKEERLSVRETENLARLFAGVAKEGENAPRQPLPSSFKKVAQGLREKLQTNVRVKQQRGKNKIEIEFKDEDDLKRLFKQITGDY